MPRPDLVSDCENCAALCCVATAFETSEDFACDKPAGKRCQFLSPAQRCTIHAQRTERGFSGCALYSCYGAGPRVTRAFAQTKALEQQRNEAFLALRVVYELLWLLCEATRLCPASRPDLRRQLAAEIAALDAIANAPFTSWRELDLRPRSRAAHAVLRRLGTALGGRRGLALL